MIYPGSLHNHTQMSNFRLRDCIIKENDLINRAIELNQSVIAITDHETISSSIRIEKIKEKVKDKIKVIMGNEIYLCRDGLNASNFEVGTDKYYHFILLAKDYKGYQQICELSTRAWMRSYMSRGMRRVPTYYSDIVEIIGKEPGHIIGSTACLGGMLATQILKYRELERSGEQAAAALLGEKILNWCKLMCSTFGGKDNFFLELQPSASREQTYVNEKIIEISKTLNIDFIITCDSHYLKKEDRSIHKAYLNASEGEREVDSFYATTYLMDTDDLKDHLTNISEEDINKAFESIIKIQNSCEDYTIRKPLVIPTLKWNSYDDVEVTQDWINKIPYFETFLKSDYIGDKELVKATIKGILKHKDLQNEKAYKELNNNLEATWISSEVNKAHWSAYYLNLQKIIELCWEAGSLVGAGRGSGVGFLLLYCLDITQINPLREKTACFPWRFLNPNRVSVLDIDFDIEGTKRSLVLSKFREFYGEDRVANVLTLRTEKSKSAILTAARGLGIDVDIAQYLASLIPSDRGQLRTLKEVFYGDEEKDFKPITTFVYEMTNNYPELWKVAQNIEGLICGTGIHAGGVIFVDEPFTNSSALMRAPDDTIITQLDLHDSEAVSFIKYDALSVEAMDKIHICLDLLLKDGLIEDKGTLKDTYENVIGIYNLERDSKEMWKMVWDHKILSLFQMEQQSGIQGIAVMKPTSVDDLAILNSTIRLMAQEKGAEIPIQKLARFKSNPAAWDEEMKVYGLTKEDKKILEPIVGISYGLCIAQEQFMQLVQLPELGGFDLTWADKLRKSIAKKNPAEYEKLTQEFFKVTKEKGCNEKLCDYVWNVLIAMSRGYGFNQSHTLAYSLIALQEMNLAYKYPTLYWDCACLISDSGSLENEIEVVDIYEKEDFENFTYIDLPDRKGKIKEKNANYDKIAKAIGSISAKGITVSLVNINTSDSSFKPDIENNRILYGLKALSNISRETVDKIKSNRPYTGIKDFMNKCPLSKTAMINLIKAGAFDEVETNFKTRKEIMAYYISQICESKKKLTLQNFNGLIQHNLIPADLEIQVRIFNFTKYLKANKKVGKYYAFDDICINFFNRFLSEYNDKIEVINGVTCIKQEAWDKIYQSYMDVARDWLKTNQKEVLEQYNDMLFLELWNKYASGNISHWEMESLCFYYSKHELAEIDNSKYGIVDFFALPADSEIDYYFKKGEIKVPIFKLSRIVGTVIAKNDNKSTISLLTTSGVVTVKFSREYYSMFKKQVSEVQSDGTKKVIEKGWFTRGTMLMITGYRRDQEFVGKTYSKTVGHQLYKIDAVNGNEIVLRHDRITGKNTIEEDE